MEIKQQIIAVSCIANTTYLPTNVCMGNVYSRYLIGIETIKIDKAFQWWHILRTLQSFSTPVNIESLRKLKGSCVNVES
jgi:hypothetical protein